MSQARILQSADGVHCPHCDEWVRQPADESIMSAPCPGCGADVVLRYEEEPEPVQQSGKSGAKLAGLLVCISAATIIGIYGFSIYRVKQSGGELTAVVVQPRPGDATIAATPEETAPGSDLARPEDEPSDTGQPADESGQKDPDVPDGGSSPPIMLTMIDEMDDHDIDPTDQPLPRDVTLADKPTHGDEPTVPGDVAVVVDPGPVDAPVDTTAAIVPPVDHSTDTAPSVQPPVDVAAPRATPVPIAPPTVDVPADTTPTDVAVAESPDPVGQIDEPAEPVVEAPPFNEEEYLESGWKSDASEVLRGFLAAQSLEERSSYVLDTDTVKASMRALQRRGIEPWQGLTPDDFKHIDLSEADRRKGIFLMLRETTADAPGATADRCYAFFKRTEGGLKLDFEVFAQTTGRLFHQFVDRPQPGFAQVFRVFITEDPAPREPETQNHQTYFVAGLSNFSTATRIRVTNVSPVGRILGAANFKSEDGSRRVMRNATVELRWTDQPENSTIELSRFICWEFLGLGGEPLDD